jgi:hypothetical protein
VLGRCDGVYRRSKGDSDKDDKRDRAEVAVAQTAKILGKKMIARWYECRQNSLGTAETTNGHRRM